MEKITKKIALLGNPNSGKSSLFNALTGLRQKTGNYPGVTVEKKSGNLQVDANTSLTLVDLPGLYSLYPNSRDEKLVVEVLLNELHPDHPDLIIYVADSTQIDKQLLLLTQVLDLNIPVILTFSFHDIAQEEELRIDTKTLGKTFGIPTLSVSSRTMENISGLKEVIRSTLISAPPPKTATPFFQPDRTETAVIRAVRKMIPLPNAYHALLLAHHYPWLTLPPGIRTDDLQRIAEENNFQSLACQIRETMHRYDLLQPLLHKTLQKKDEGVTLTDKIDNIVTHRWLGPLLFFTLMFFVFQAIYSWASIPMDWIDGLFTTVNEGITSVLPDSLWRNLLTDGLLTGLGGILIFIPQIAILFFLIGLLENVGYMARAVYIFDKVMQKFGLNGRSIVSLISGGACAIPAVMATRTISNWKERLITILITPLISCSARIPVFVMIIGLVIPSKQIFGVFNLQGLAFLGLYLAGIAAALFSALFFKYVLKNEEKSFLMMELPTYRTPNLKDVLLGVGDKVRSFVVEAGKIIMVISIILWAMASFGPGNEMEMAVEKANEEVLLGLIPADESENYRSSKKLEASYAGHLGKFIEPAIKPLGYDWKIGIALVTSFAAREVFVGTVATLYSLGTEGDIMKIRDRLAKEKHPETGEPIFNLATGLSLLVFYLLAMQCMSTMAVVKRETGGWKWPLLQFTFMSLLAYFSSLAVYQLLV